MEFDFFVYHDNYKKILSISPVEQNDYPYPYVKIPYSQVQTYLDGKEKLSQANIIFYNSKPHLINQNFVLEINPNIQQFKKVLSSNISVLNISLNSSGKMLFKLDSSKIKNLDENFPDTIVNFYLTPLDDHDILYQNSFTLTELIKSQKIGFKIPRGLEIDQVDIWITDIFALYNVDLLEEENSIVELTGLYDCKYNISEINFCAIYQADKCWLETESPTESDMTIYCCKNSDPTIVYQTVILSNNVLIEHRIYDFYSFDKNIQCCGLFEISNNFRLIKQSQLTDRYLQVLVTKNEDLTIIYKSTDINKNTSVECFDYFSKIIPIN